MMKIILYIIIGIIVLKLIARTLAERGELRKKKVLFYLAEREGLEINEEDMKQDIFPNTRITLYSTLSRCQEEGLVRGKQAGREGGWKRVYQLTEQGKHWVLKQPDYEPAKIIVVHTMPDELQK